MRALRRDVRAVRTAHVCARSRAGLTRRRGGPRRAAPAPRPQALRASTAAREGASRLVGFASSNVEYVEHAFKRDTVGLQTKEQFAEKARRRGAARARLRRRVARRCSARSCVPRSPRRARHPQRANIEKELAAERARAASEAAEAAAAAQSRRRAAAKAAATARLSFADEEAEEEAAAAEEDDDMGKEKAGGAGAAAAGGADPAAKRPRLALGGVVGGVGKDPSVNTSFLPDRAREAAEAAERARLREEWLAQQAALKAQPLQVTYSYWDGSGHRRSVTIRQGDTIGAFLRAVREQLAPEFRELKSASVDGMLYVKEDLIMPHSLTFHELIVSRARGKSGPLFHFDVHDDVRAAGDARLEKDEAHAGKVLERHWYDKNKHIFPASRWEVYDPAKDYGRYTIHGGEVQQ